jgi:hypothetical protein
MVLAMATLAGCHGLPWDAHRSKTGSGSAASIKATRHNPPPPVGAQPDDAPVPELTGMSRPQVVTVLGQPDARVQSSPSEGWTYRAGSCTVRLDFFLDITRNDYYALGRSVSGVKDDSEARRCLKRIASRAKPS